MKFVCQNFKPHLSEFWHLQELSFDTYKIPKKIDTYKDQHSHSPSSDWQTLTSYFIPPLIELNRESCFLSSKYEHEFTSSKAHSHLSSDQCVWVGVVPDEGSILPNLYKNIIIKVQNDHLIVLSKVFVEHHHLPCML